MTLPTFVPYSLALAVAVGLLHLVYRVSRIGMRPKGYPPGPPTLPIIGNLHQMPRKDVHLQYQKWIDEYGPIISLKLGTQTLILLGSGRMVSDLFEKRGGNYSSRWHSTFREFGNEYHVATHPYDQVWRRQRRLYTTHVSGNQANKYLPYQSFESLYLLRDLIKDPDEFRDHLERYTISIACTIAYGRRCGSVKVGPGRILLDWFAGNINAVANTKIADWFPVFRPLFHIVPSKTKTRLLELNKLESDLWSDMWNGVAEKMKLGLNYPSMCRDSILDWEQEKKSTNVAVDIREPMFNVGHAWAAATDTQANTLAAFVKAMVLFPDVQAKAREEVDRIVGDSRLPEWKDRPDMPIVRRCVDETLRWMPTTLTGGPMPHSTMNEDTYQGYSIPANAGLYNCVWTINNDPSVYDDPRTFNPLRFSEDVSGSETFHVSTDYSIRPHLTFGAGRRVCPGSYVAVRTLFLTMARLLWAFEFSPKLDASGKPIPIEPDALTPGLVVGPAHFECEIKPRSAAKAQLIERLCVESDANLNEEGNYNEKFFNDAWNSSGLRQTVDGKA